VIDEAQHFLRSRRAEHIKHISALICQLDATFLLRILLPFMAK
jgi:hypothetical protein